MPADSPLSPQQEKAVEGALTELFYYCRGFYSDESYRQVVGPHLRALVREVVQPVEKERVPGLDLDTISAHLESAHRITHALCNGRIRWRMSIPARPDEDPDLIIGQALRDADLLLERVREAEKAGAALAEALGDIMSGYGDYCECDDHTSENCCNQAEEPCAFCLADAAFLAWSQRTPKAPGGEIVTFISRNKYQC